MFVIVSLLVLIIVYFYGIKNHNYWKKRGIKFEEPIPFFGGLLKQQVKKITLSERFANLYKQYPNEKYVGFFQGNSQGLLLRDPELIKHVLVTDFRKHHYRSFLDHEMSEPLLMNLFCAEGDVWKLLRQKLTPVFSSAKLKAMFPLIMERAETLQKVADRFAETGKEIDAQDLMARYTIDFIGACGFGIDTDTLNNEDSDFRKLSKDIFVVTKRSIIVVILKTLSPNIFKHVHLVRPEIEHKIINLVKQIMTQRNYMPSGRNDFIDLMLELRQNGTIVGESMERRNSDGSIAKAELEFSDMLCIAQVFIFFAAGFETSSTATSFLLHNLAYHPEEQSRCQQEIDEILERYDGKLNFDAVKEMKYLEMALKESLRLLPPSGIILRKCMTKCTLPGTELTIDKGTKIYISSEALHSDEKYFKDPEEFKPQRFHPNNIDNMTKFVYMPFGVGPRSCIGERMAMMLSLAGVAAILRKFSVAPSTNSIRKPVIDPKSTVIQNIVGGLPLILNRRDLK